MPLLIPSFTYEFATEIQRRPISTDVAEFVEFYTRPVQQLPLQGAHVM